MPHRRDIVPARHPQRDLGSRAPSKTKRLMSGGYKPKTKSLPVWLDKFLYGPPAVRDSSPGIMAALFGRTEHDTTTYAKGKGPLQRGANGMLLILSYIAMLNIPFVFIHMQGLVSLFDSLFAA